MKAALFLDRDGILNRIVQRGETVSSPWRFEEFELLPQAEDLLRAGRDAGMTVVVVTNQPDISRGNLPEAELRRMHEMIEQVLQPDAIEVCTSGDNSDPRRKPNPGMLLDAAKNMDLDLPSSVFIGDSAKDVGAGKAAGVTTVLLQTAYNTAAHGTADVNCDSYDELISYMTQRRTTA